MNSAQMEVLTDNVVVFCLNINKDLEMSKLKKGHTRWPFNYLFRME